MIWPTEAFVTRMNDQKSGMTLEVRDLGRMPYARALAIQREVNLAVSKGTYIRTDASGSGTETSADQAGTSDIEADTSPGGCLLLVEHDPVITVTHRQGAWDNLLAPAKQLEEMGIAVEITDRGGDITYHGPGQLVAYPILKLNPLGLNLGSYMRLLEQVVIEVLQTFNITGQRDPDATGVWVEVSGNGCRGSGLDKRKPDASDQQALLPDTRDPIPETRLAKLCAMGVRVRKNTTMHGLALNVTTDLTHFQTIDPCGLGGRPVTSLAELLGNDAPAMEAVKEALVNGLQSATKARFTRPSP